MSESIPKSSIVLAIETSGDICGVAVLRNGELIAEHTFRHGMHLSERLIGHIDGVLEESSASLEALDIIAVGIGPGSFTGTRVGVMTAKTLASLRTVALYGINALEAHAFEYAGLADTAVVPTAPCRRGVVYTASYRVGGVLPELVLPPEARTFEELGSDLKLSPSSRILFCGPSSSKSHDELTEIGGASGKIVQFAAAANPRAFSIGRLAYLYSESGKKSDSPFDLIPLYISPPPITLPKPKA